MEILVPPNRFSNKEDEQRPAFKGCERKRKISDCEELTMKKEKVTTSKRRKMTDDIRLHLVTTSNEKIDGSGNPKWNSSSSDQLADISISRKMH